jgi:hypothetical protein
MSDNGYASKDALRELSRKERRYGDAEISAWGKIKLGAPTAGEFCRIDAAKNRALMLAGSGKIGEQAAALRDYFVEICKTIIVEPSFSEDDREYLLSLEAPLAAEIKDACLEFANLTDTSVEDAEKK